MKGSWRSFVVALVAIALVESVGSSVFKNTAGMFTSFPHFIGHDVKEIVIENSNIPVIDYIEAFPALFTFTFTNNELTKFPDFTNVSAVLQWLTLSDNKITTVQLVPMPRLRLLDLKNNRLTQLPDLAKVSQSLVTLTLSNNSISDVDAIPPMAALKIVRLDENPLGKFPDLGNASATVEELYVMQNAIGKIDRLPVLPRLRLLKVGRCQVDEFPDLANVSSSLEELYIYRCLLPSVAYMPKMDNLRRLLLYRNNIREFLPLANVSSSLVELDLSYNDITQLGHVPAMAALRTVNLEGNRLAEFPDFSNAAATLAVLKLAKNAVQYLPQRRVDSLRFLEYLDLRDNPVVTLPILCHLNDTVQLLLSDPGLICDWRMAFVKMMETAGEVLYPEDAPKCSQPPHLASENWADITALDLLNETDSLFTPADNRADRFQRMNTQTWSCPLMILATYSLDTLHCGALCGRQRNCFMFSSLNGHCILTGRDVGSPNTFDNERDWYIKN